MNGFSVSKNGYEFIPILTSKKNRAPSARVCNKVDLDPKYGIFAYIIYASIVRYFVRNSSKNVVLKKIMYGINCLAQCMRSIDCSE